MIFQCTGLPFSVVIHLTSPRDAEEGNLRTMDMHGKLGTQFCNNLPFSPLCAIFSLTIFYFPSSFLVWSVLEVVWGGS